MVRIEGVYTPPNVPNPLIGALILVFWLSEGGLIGEFTFFLGGVFFGKILFVYIIISAYFSIKQLSI